MIIAGVAVGGGWQALVAYINLFCYYVVGLPFGFLLGYKLKFGVQVKILIHLSPFHRLDLISSPVACIAITMTFHSCRREFGLE